MIKKTSKVVARSILLQSKKAIIRVPIFRRAAMKAKATLFPGMVSGALETYHYHNHYPSIAEYIKQVEASKHFSKKPLISIIMPTYNTPDRFLRDCIDSVLLQSYPNWELCIADDASSSPLVIKTIKEYIKQDKRIKLVARKTNGHISLATNSALDIARGEFISLLDHDDALWPNALYEVVSVINETPDVDLIYTDEDKIDSSGVVHSYPFLKPDWSPEFLESCNYITHFSTIRASVMHDIGGLRKGYEGAQDWDLFIRITEKTQNIIHIPKLLYSWRIHEDSTAANTDAKPYVYEAQAKLLADHIKRVGRRADVETGIITQHRTIKYAVDSAEGLTVVVDYMDMQQAQLRLPSLLEYNPGVDLDVIVAPRKAMTHSEELDLRKLVPKLSLQFAPVTLRGQPDYNKLASMTTKNYLFFVKDSIEIGSSMWAKTAIGDCQLDRVGLVGPVILHADRKTIASAGIGLGYGRDGVIDMLQGTPFEDQHYSRGLYAKSRRNVSAVNDAAYFIKRQTLQEVTKQATLSNVLELAIALRNRGFRHIYTPYIQVITHDYLTVPTTTETYPEDPLLNPNFNHMNQRMEVRS